jgi:hypothetical protein
MQHLLSKLEATNIFMQESYTIVFRRHDGRTMHESLHFGVLFADVRDAVAEDRCLSAAMEVCLVLGKLCLVSGQAAAEAVTTANDIRCVGPLYIWEKP